MPPLRFALLVLVMAPAAAPAAQRPAPSPAALEAQAEGHVVRAVAALTLDNDSAAVRHAEAALAIAPGAAAPLDVLADAYLALGRTTDALYHASLAAQAAPDEASVHLRLARAQRAAGQRDAALASAETAARLSPTDAAAGLLLADLYDAASRTADAVDAVERLTQVYDAPELRRRLAALRERAGQTGLASTNRPDAEVRSPATTSGANAAPDAEAALATVAADPRRLDAWAAALTALAAASDPRAGDTADEATLLFPTVPSILAPAAEAYLAARRPADAARAARAGLAALDAAPDAALRARLERALATATR